MKMTRILPIVIASVLLGACGNGAEPRVEDAGQPAGESHQAKKNPAEASESPADPAGEDHGEAEDSSVQIVDFGYGEDEWSGQAIVVVTSDDEEAVGEYVTASISFLNQDGELIATEERIELINWAGQRLALPTWFDIGEDPSSKVDTVVPSIAVSSYGLGSEPREALPVLDAEVIKLDKYRGFIPVFKYTNETAADIERLRVNIVCYDDDDKIIGGKPTYQNLAPKGKQIAIETDVVVSEEPAACKAFLNYGA